MEKMRTIITGDRPIYNFISPKISLNVELGIQEVKGLRT